MWDPVAKAVYIEIYVHEKNGATRTLVYTPNNTHCVNTYTAVCNYMWFEHPCTPTYPHLFHVLTRPGVTPRGFCNNTLRRLCRRLKLPPHTHNHHMFSANVVNRHMATKTGRLEAAQKFLGHRSITTTFRHYWIAPESLAEL